jgi:nucleotide-binding universal stress UspA family protein
MIRVSNILFATDFSPYSNQAYFHAVALAESHKATLEIVHVYKSPPALLTGHAEDMSQAAGDQTENAAYWRGQLEQVRPVNPRIPVRHLLLFGDPADEILRHAVEAHSDLIVLGTHGRTGLARLLLGSVAEKVLRGAPCSVLVVKMPQPVAVPKPAAEAATLRPEVSAVPG